LIERTCNNGMVSVQLHTTQKKVAKVVVMLNILYPP
jgi:hypothetical protein